MINLQFGLRLVFSRNCFRNIHLLEHQRNHKKILKAVEVSKFHTSQQRYVPQVHWMVLRSSGKVVGPLFGRLFRRWWFKLEEQKRRKYYEFFMAHRQKLIYASGGSVSASIIYFLYNQEPTPITGRRRFVTFTDAQFQQIVDYEAENALSKIQHRIIGNRDWRIPKIKKVVLNLIQANSDLPKMKDIQWKLLLVDFPDNPTCFCLPSGEIVVSTQFLQEVENMDQLAIVMAHEMSHILLEHAKEKLSQEGFVDWFLVVLSSIIWAIVPLPFFGFLSSASLEASAEVLLHLPYSRKLELEADSVGLNMAAKACYDVRESYVFWKNMSLRSQVRRDKDDEIPAFISTHPSHEDRAKNMDALISQALKIRASCNCRQLKGGDPREFADAKQRFLDEPYTVKFSHV